MKSKCPSSKAKKDQACVGLVPAVLQTNINSTINVCAFDAAEDAVLPLTNAPEFRGEIVFERDRAHDGIKGVFLDVLSHYSAVCCVRPFDGLLQNLQRCLGVCRSPVVSHFAGYGFVCCPVFSNFWIINVRTTGTQHVVNLRTIGARERREAGCNR